MVKNIVIVLLVLALGISLYFQQRETDPEVKVTVVSDPYAPVRAVLDELQDTPEFAPATIGFCLLNDTGPLVELNAYQSMIPASSLKAVTAATALEILGVDFQFETTVRATTSLAGEGLLEGDVIIEGGGDPTLGSADLEKWAEAMHEKGWRKITGRIIGDARYFPDDLAANAWDWGDLSNYYGAGPSGLNLDYNRFEALLKPAETVGDPAVWIGSDPELPWIRWVNQMVTGTEDQSYIYGGPYAETLVLRGTIPANEDPFTCRGAIPDPAYYAALQFTEALRAAGIEVEGDPTTMRRLTIEGQELPEGKIAILSHSSETLPSIVKHLMAVSDNMATECLFLTMAKTAGDGRDGEEIIRDHWKERGLELKGLRMEDGSGLARADFIRPHDLAKISYLAQTGPSGEVYRESLNSYLDGRIRLKGGAMSKVRTSVGIIQSVSGQEYTFALMFNNADATSASLAEWRSKVFDAILNL